MGTPIAPICSAQHPCGLCTDRDPDPYRGEPSHDGKLRGFEHHPLTCAVHRGYPTAWGHGCDCGMLDALAGTKP